MRAATSGGVVAGEESLLVPIRATPAYEVLEQIGEVEIRRYRCSLLAEVTLASPSQESVAMAIDCFARYVFGPDGPSDERLFSEPAPCPHQRGRGDWRLRFFIASDLRIEDAPAPMTEALRLVSAPAWLGAALAYEPKASGRMVHAARRKLQETIRATARYQLDDRSEWRAYDLPFTLPFGARPETLVELCEASSTEADTIWELMTNSGRRPRVSSAA